MLQIILKPLNKFKILYQKLLEELDRLIIDSKEEDLLKYTLSDFREEKDRTTPSDGLYPFLISFQLRNLIPTIEKHFHLVSDPENFSMVRGLIQLSFGFFSVVILMNIFSIRSLESINFVNLGSYLIRRLIHPFWLINKEKRNQEIEAFRQARITNLTHAEHGGNFGRLMNHFLRSPNSSPLETDNQEIIKSFSLNPTGFIESHFNKSQSFKRWYLERAFIDSKVNENFIHNTLLIPKRKEMPIESLKQVLIALTYFECGVKYSDDLYEKISNSFKDFSPLEISHLYLRGVDSESYEQILTSSLKDTVFTVCNSFSKLHDQVTKKNIYHTKLTHLDGVSLSNGATSKLLRTGREFKDASELFINCVKNYHNKLETDVIIFKKDEEAVACVRVEQNKVVEIKGFQNSEVPSNLKKEIKNLIDESLRKQG